MDRTAPGGGLALALYRALWGMAAPLAPSLLRKRVARGKEDPSRLGERAGFGAAPRPHGTLIWIHGASVGESLAVLPLVSALLAKPGRHVLVTTGTVTSAQLMAERLPARAFHHYVPLDAPASVRRFLDHWRPDLALFVESEFWPNLILETQQRGVPMALVNARLSERSFRGWRRAPGLARRLLSAFDICLAQDESIAARLTALGARKVVIAGSLKADAPPLPVDGLALAAFRESLGARAVFLAASTHPGEDEGLLAVAEHWRGLENAPLTIIVPRHPARGAEIETLALERGLRVVRRAGGDLPTAQTEIYIADTLGELGLFYRASRFAFLGGSLVAHGGQNPLEAARLETAILAGPHTENFEAIFHLLFQAQGEGRVRTMDELRDHAAALIADPEKAENLAARAKIAADGLSGALKHTQLAAETLLAHARA
jgi:3-deoxy-D-manno-octulosonic-acid transferase